MSPLKILIALVAMMVIGKACSAAGDRVEARMMQDMKPRVAEADAELEQAKGDEP